MIIDMQDSFILRNPRASMFESNDTKAAAVLKQISALIEEAKQNQRPIILVEYQDMGPSNEKIAALLKDYKKAYTVIKNDDGVFDDKNSKEAVEKIMLNSGTDRLIVTGANGGACVDLSIHGSIEQRYTTFAVSDAIADFNFDQFIYPYDQYEHYEEKNCPGCKFQLITTETARSELNPENKKAINSSSRNSPKSVDPHSNKTKNQAPQAISH